MRRPPTALAVVLALLVGGTALGAALPREDAPRPAADQVPVVGASALCPDLRQDAATTTVAYGLPPGGGGADVERTVLSDDPLAPAVNPLEPGQVVAAQGGTVTGGYGLQATGGGAAGLAVTQTTTALAGPGRGLTTLACRPAGTGTWLVGGGAAVGERAELVLVNPDPEPASVDVAVLSAEGPVDDRPGRGLVVPAEGRLVVPLEELAPDRSRLAVGVDAVRGRVAAALRTTRTDGVVPRGLEHAAAGPAAEELVLPGVPAGPGARALVVGNPSDVDVEVAVELTTADGQFVPEALDALVVPAMSTVSADLSGPLGPSPAAVRVTSEDGPVVAAVLVEEGDPAVAQDLAYAGPAGPLRGPALVPDVVAGDRETTVLLSALEGDAVVDVAPLGVAAPPRRVEVPGGRTVAVPVSSLLPAGATGRLALLVTPDEAGAPVHAGVHVVARPAEGPLTTVTALTGSTPPVDRPAVVRDPGVG